DGLGAQLCPCDRCGYCRRSIPRSRPGGTQYSNAASARTEEPERPVAAQPVSARFELVTVDLRSFKTLVPRVHLPVSLAEPEPSGSTHPSRRCRGCFPPFCAFPQSGCPLLLAHRYDSRRVKASHLHAINSASWRTLRFHHQATRSMPPII